METNQQLDDGRIDAAMKAYATITPDSLTAFRELNDLEAIVVIRVLKEKYPPKVPRKRRADAGTARTAKVPA